MVHLEEWRAGGPERPRTRPGKGWCPSSPEEAARAAGSGIAQVVAAAFLPSGWPASTPTDYLAYQSMDTLQALSSYVRGLIAMRAVLEGLGVGDASKTVLSATLTWILKDGSGLLTGLLFSWIAAARVDASPKFYRLVADISNDIALTIELAAPSIALWAGLGQAVGSGSARADLAFFSCLCLANALKAVCGVAAGCVRVVLTQHFASRGNAADVNAKESSQETAITIAGMLVGSAALAPLDASPSLQWASFGAMTALHVWANWRAVSALRLTTLNRNRLEAAIGACDAAAAVGREGPLPGIAVLTNDADPVWPDAAWALPVPPVAGRAASLLAKAVAALWWLAGSATAAAWWPIGLLVTPLSSAALMVPLVGPCLRGANDGLLLDRLREAESAELAAAAVVGTAEACGDPYSSSVELRVGCGLSAIGSTIRSGVEASALVAAALRERGFAVVPMSPATWLRPAGLAVLLADAPGPQRARAAACGYARARWLRKRIDSGQLVLGEFVGPSASWGSDEGASGGATAFASARLGAHAPATVALGDEGWCVGALHKE